jgi:hypothetical protein
MSIKEDIKKKLLKYAKELGKTPSEKVFYEYAEIGIYDLKRCGYPNYGELVRDVGLPPNKFDKTKYNPGQLRKLFIKVIREEGKWPTRGLLDIRHFSNKNFPDSSTFYKNLGQVKNLALNILEFIEDKQGYDDIAVICNSTLSEFENDIQEATDVDKGGVGYVYLLKSSLNNAVAYKIGKTKNLEQRIKQLRQPSNVEELIHPIKTDDIDGVEQYWLNRFSNKRLYPNRPKDEWFKLNASDVKAFRRWRRIF